MAKQIDLVRELLDRHCLITPESYEILEDLDADIVDIDRLAEALKDEIVVTPEKLREALASYEDLLSEGNLEEEVENNELVESKPTTKVPSKKPEKDSSKEEIKHTPSAKVQKTEFEPIGKQIKTEINILYESSGKTTIEGNIKDFQTYFKSRYNQLFSILKGRGDISGSITLKDLMKAKLEPNEKITIICIVTDKRTLKNGGLLLELEDATGKLTARIPAKMQELLVKAGALLNDQIAGFSGRFYEDMFILDDFVFPDIPIVTRKSTIKEPISVCMTSDLHIGSKEFLEDSFNGLLDFLNGRIDDPYQQSLASQIKYLIINGDLVEGIGVYPKQEEDLLITDIYDQYKRADQILSKVPDWIHIIITSGNHDACRLALPQPAISKEYAPDLWKRSNVTFLSNPTTVDLHKKTFLIYHGNSFEDIASLTPGLSMNDPNGPMLHTLRYRHLAPTFGRNTSIVPSIKDELVIEKVPNVYHTGHIHINSHTQYRGVDCVNSGTFQSQTEYMQSKNIIPTPGRVPILNLHTNKLHELVFFNQSEIRK
ncbi:MAG: DNA-directed DNA polymerase II small subunit [Candidatus Heimdallarchaeota archaeon]|nr:DNA-directed DNA polymerase II small subunit [Candidatus Heimdallarchaeota archaeon]MBY8994261.1 DNA-directed DNA polymerase II small subunit [Candidatus Heimdallarchaeota archaeon]